MFRLLVLLSILFIVDSISAQSCSPDPQYADSSAGVYPAPVTDMNPDGGIPDPACKGAYYEFPLTIIVPDSVTIDFNGFPITLKIITAQIPTEGAIEGLPNGIDYLCMPSDCTFPADSSGCLLLFGTVNESVIAGAYPLSIQLDITLDGLGTQTFDFPGPQFPGSYDLTVIEPEDPLCTNNTEHINAEEVNIFPNPTIGPAITVNKFPPGSEYSIKSLNGLTLQSGRLNGNQIMVENIQAGIYIIHLRNNGLELFRKIVITN